MNSTQNEVRKIALRIEQAYRRKYPRWVPLGLTLGVWESAANRLLEGSMRHAAVPIDPELFVAVQPSERCPPDPWVELTQQGARNFYLKAIRRMIRLLRKELKAEVRRGEGRLLEGVGLDEVLATDGSRISPLSRLILAHRWSRPDLFSLHLSCGFKQHQSCPLYRLAARSLLPAHAYPDSAPEAQARLASSETISFSLN